MSAPPGPLRILHLSAFESDDGPARLVQLINGFGRGCAHSMVWATPPAITPGRKIDRSIAVDTSVDFPNLQGRRLPRRLQHLASAMQGYDLVLAYGYGAIDAVLAHTLFGGHMQLPPLVHHEDATPPRRVSQNWVRRIALGRAAALIVASPRLAAIALADWHQPRWRVQCIAPGIRTADFAAKPRRDALPRVIKRPGELWLGVFGAPAPVEALIGLVRALSTLAPPWQLVMLGEAAHQSDRDAVRDEALRLDLAHRVHWPGVAAAHHQMIGLFDLCAMPDGSDHGPPAIVAAMAAGLAVVAADAGDATAWLAPENRPFVVAPADAAGFAAALRALTEAPALREAIGAANRWRARAEYDEASMIAAYRGVYAAALGRTSFP